MTETTLTSRPAHALAAAVRTGDLQATDVLQAFVQRIEAHDGGLGAFVDLYGDRTIRQAEAVDAARARGEDPGPLAGVPVAVKDAFLLAGEETGCASEILAGFRAPFTATCLERLEAAGAVLLGRTNLDEFAMGSSTEHSRHGVTRNPFDRARTPGGSSGGSAAAVAARFAPLALGSDTGGSVRQPAAFCGVTGLKATYGRIPRYGLVAFASSLDHVAPFGRDVRDLALSLQVMAGVDRRDPTSLAAPVPDYLAELDRGIAGLRLGVPEEWFGDGLDPEVEAAVRAAVDQLEALGARVVPVQLPHSRYAIPTYYLICTAEAASNLARYDGVRYGQRAPGDRDLDGMYSDTRSAGFGREVQTRILLGTFCLSSGYRDAYYDKASRVRTLLRRDYTTAFEQCDLLVGPTTPTPAFALGDKLDDPVAMYLNDVLTVSANLVGVPALSIPCGQTTGGLPIGLQLQGPLLAEATLLRCAAAYEAVHPHHLREPVLAPAAEEGR